MNIYSLSTCLLYIIHKKEAKESPNSDSSIIESIHLFLGSNSKRLLCILINSAVHIGGISFTILAITIR